MTRNLRTIAHAVVAAALIGCGGASDRSQGAAGDTIASIGADAALRARQDSVNRAQPGYIVDSILPVSEEIRRFGMAVGGAPVTALGHGAQSKEDLVQAFAAAIAARDTARLRDLALTPREFIDLVYPTSPHTKPPLRQSPALVWSQIQLPSGSGLRRALDRLGGRSLRIDGVACGSRRERQGRNVLHVACDATFTSGNDATRSGRLFGTIIERDGRFKFISYSNMF